MNESDSIESFLQTEGVLEAQLSLVSLEQITRSAASTVYDWAYGKEEKFMQKL